MMTMTSFALDVLAKGTTPEDVAISPGLVGFLATFAIVIAVVLLMLNMVSRIRRLEHRRRIAEAEAAERRRNAEQSA